MPPYGALAKEWDIAVRISFKRRGRLCTIMVGRAVPSPRGSTMG